MTMGWKIWWVAKMGPYFCAYSCWVLQHAEGLCQCFQ